MVSHENPLPDITTENQIFTIHIVPKPKPGVFRITKNIHNILQGVADPNQRVSEEEKKTITDWITDNANRYWLAEGGPLRPPEEGGADVIMVSLQILIYKNIALSTLC